MTSDLFVYGTLRDPRVLQMALGRCPPGQQAVLTDFRRRRIRGENYPGIIPAAGERVDGLRIRGIREEEWGRLDSYESDLYVRQVVQIRLDDGTEAAAWAYVIPPRNQACLSDEPWELNQTRPGSSPAPD